MGKIMRSPAACTGIELKADLNFPVVKLTHEEVIYLITSFPFKDVFPMIRKLCRTRGLSYNINLGVVSWWESGTLCYRNFYLPKELRQPIKFGQRE